MICRDKDSHQVNYGGNGGGWWEVLVSELNPNLRMPSFMCIQKQSLYNLDAGYLLSSANMLKLLKDKAKK